MTIRISQKNVDNALKRLGHYRVVRAQEQVESRENYYDLFGSHLLALGLRETWGQNIRGGAMWDAVNSRWVVETDPKKQDVGWLQISAKFHRQALQAMVAVEVGTWSPLIPHKTAYDAGMAPRYTDSLRYTVNELERSIVVAAENGVSEKQVVRVALAAHNAGIGGAVKGYREGNIDKYTANGDYSAWVLVAERKVVDFLNRHPEWKWKE